jgi:hypothetical protein
LSANQGGARAPTDTYLGAAIGYSLVERQLFLSMDVIFRENESYYPFRVIFPFGDSPYIGSMRQEGESSAGERLVHVGIMSCLILIDQMMSE